MSTIDVNINEETTENQETEEILASEKQVENPNEEKQIENNTEENQETTPVEIAQQELQQAQKAEEDVKENLAQKGIDFEKCAEEYLERGNLSDATYQKLAEAGFTKNVVDAYIAGVNAQNERLTSTILNTVGGQEEYDKITAFIQSQGNSAIDAYNALVDSGNLSAIAMYLNGCKAQMILKTGTANRSILGGQTSPAEVGFENEAEMTKAMSDPRYRTDPDYVKQVAKKLEKSSFVKYGR